jgi:hypothetical protein
VIFTDQLLILYLKVTAMSKKSLPPSALNLPRIGEKVFDRYRIERTMTLKQSGQEVQQAQDTIFDIKVVIRYLTETKYHDTFKKTGQSMTKLSVHTNVASVFEYKSISKVPDCIIREFIEGGNAEGYFNSTLCITLAEKMEKVLVMSVEIANALSYLQEQGICCTNIALSNILLTYDGVFKIADVGLWNEDASLPLESKVLEQFCAAIQQAFNYIKESHPGENIDLSLAWKKYQADINNPVEIGSLVNLKQRAENLLQEIEQARKEKLDSLINREFKPIDRENIYTELREVYEEVKNLKIGTKLDNILQIIEKEEKEEKENKEESPLYPIKDIVRKNTEESVQRIVESLYNYPGLTTIDQEKLWYATILMRSSERQQPNRSMGKYFVPVFYGQYKDSRCIASSDWQKDKEVQEVLIDNSCAGLPIVWYSNKIIESDKKWLGCESDANDFVEYCTLINLQTALNESEYIGKTYKSANTLRMKMKNEAGKCPEMAKIASMVETEIVVPIYGSFQKDYRGKADNIIGVVNFEFEQKFDQLEAKIIGKTLNSIVKNEPFLPNEIVCDLLSITFPPKNNKVEISKDPQVNKKEPNPNEYREVVFHNSIDNFKEFSLYP